MAGAKITGSASGYILAVEGLREVDLALDGAEDRILKAASMAINTTADRMRTRAARLLNEQIAFGTGYLTRGGENARLRVSKRARPSLTTLEARITGRDRPTSLSRFVKGVKRHGRQNPRVEVSPGATKTMTGAFLMNLKSGNLGLAIRLKPGEKVRNKHVMVAAYSMRSQNRRRPSDRNLYLLYGPSVDQVFRDVSQDLVPEAAAFLEREVARLLGDVL